MMFVEGRG